MAERPELPELGVGLMFFPGLEPVVHAALQSGDAVLDYLEVEPQPLSRRVQGRLRLRPEPAAFLADLPVPKLVHSVGAPVAGTVHTADMLQPAADAVTALAAPWASEHLNLDRVPSERGSDFQCFLLPALQTPAAVDVAARNIDAMRRQLGVPVAVETPVNYLRPVAGEMTDGAFYAAVAERGDCGLLVDVHNLWCNERNGRQSVLEVLDELPVERVWELHLAGGRQLGGYWVDAHSGPVDADLWGLAEQVVRRLPVLKAMTFEVMPEYLTAGDVDAAAILDQLRRMRSLWAQRGRDAGARRRVRRGTYGHRGLPSPEAWERSLGASLSVRTELPARTAGGPVLDLLAADPGLEVYRTMIRSVRTGVVVDSLRLTYRLLTLSAAEERAEQLFDRYLAETVGQPVALDEARQFRDWLRSSDVGVAHIVEVAEFEVALADVHADGEPRTVRFSREPMDLLAALGAGRLPAPDLEPGGTTFELELTP